MKYGEKERVQCRRDTRSGWEVMVWTSLQKANMDGDDQNPRVPSELFRDFDARNRENVARVDLGKRTSADIFEASQRAYEQARLEMASRRRQTEGSIDTPSSETIARLDSEIAFPTNMSPRLCRRSMKRRWLMGGLPGG